MVNGEQDAELVARCLRGEVEAFEPLVLRYQRAFLNVAWRMLGNREDAQDVVQGAFVKAWEKLGSFDPRYRFFSWMYRIVVNESLNARGRRPPFDSLVADIPATGGPEEALRSRERRDSLQAALLGLNEGERQVIVLRHFAELSYADIGDALGLAEKTVKSRLHEARQRLGRMLPLEDLS